MMDNGVSISPKLPPDFCRIEFEFEFDLFARIILQ